MSNYHAKLLAITVPKKKIIKTIPQPVVNRAVTFNKALIMPDEEYDEFDEYK